MDPALPDRSSRRQAFPAARRQARVRLDLPPFRSLLLHAALCPCSSGASPAGQLFDPAEWLLRAALLACLAALDPCAAHAHHPASNPTGHEETPVAAVPGAGPPAITSALPALGDLKKGLLDHGINLQFSYIQDTFGNPAGGVRQGAVYGSVLYMAIDADLAKFAGLPGLSLRVNAYQIQGGNLSASNILNYSTISGFSARPTARLFELWAEQKLFANLASVRFGQLTADDELFISEFAASLFINVTFGWSNLFIQDLPGGGGPNYPCRRPASASNFLL